MSENCEKMDPELKKKCIEILEQRHDLVEKIRAFKEDKNMHYAIYKPALCISLAHHIADETQLHCLSTNRLIIEASNRSLNDLSDAVRIICNSFFDDIHIFALDIFQEKIAKGELVCAPTISD
jgi:DNA-binding protein